MSGVMNKDRVIIPYIYLFEKFDKTYVIRSDFTNVDVND